MYDRPLRSGRSRSSKVVPDDGDILSSTSLWTNDEELVATKPWITADVQERQANLLRTKRQRRRTCCFVTLFATILFIGIAVFCAITAAQLMNSEFDDVEVDTVDIHVAPSLDDALNQFSACITAMAAGHATCDAALTVNMTLPRLSSFHGVQLQHVECDAGLVVPIGGDNPDGTLQRVFLAALSVDGGAQLGAGGGGSLTFSAAVTDLSNDALRELRSLLWADASNSSATLSLQCKLTAQVHLLNFLNIGSHSFEDTFYFDLANIFTWPDKGDADLDDADNNHLSRRHGGDASEPSDMFTPLVQQPQHMLHVQGLRSASSIDSFALGKVPALQLPVYHVNLHIPNTMYLVWKDDSAPMASSNASQHIQPCESSHAVAFGLEAQSISLVADRRWSRSTTLQVLSTTTLWEGTTEEAVEKAINTLVHGSRDDRSGLAEHLALMGAREANHGGAVWNIRSAHVRDNVLTYLLGHFQVHQLHDKRVGSEDDIVQALFSLFPSSRPPQADTAREAPADPHRRSSALADAGWNGPQETSHMTVSNVNVSLSFYDTMAASPRASFFADLTLKDSQDPGRWSVDVNSSLSWQSQHHIGFVGNVTCDGPGNSFNTSWDVQMTEGPAYSQQHYVVSTASMWYTQDHPDVFVLTTDFNYADVLQHASIDANVKLRINHQQQSLTCKVEATGKRSPFKTLSGSLSGTYDDSSASRIEITFNTDWIIDDKTAAKSVGWNGLTLSWPSSHQRSGLPTKLKTQFQLTGTSMPEAGLSTSLLLEHMSSSSHASASLDSMHATLSFTGASSLNAAALVNVTSHGDTVGVDICKMSVSSNGDVLFSLFDDTHVTVQSSNSQTWPTSITYSFGAAGSTMPQTTQGTGRLSVNYAQRSFDLDISTWTFTWRMTLDVEGGWHRHWVSDKTTMAIDVSKAKYAFSDESLMVKKWKSFTWTFDHKALSLDWVVDTKFGGSLTASGGAAFASQGTISNAGKSTVMSLDVLAGSKVNVALATHTKIVQHDGDNKHKLYIDEASLSVDNTAYLYTAGSSNVLVLSYGLGTSESPSISTSAQLYFQGQLPGTHGLKLQGSFGSVSLGDDMDLQLSVISYNTTQLSLAYDVAQNSTLLLFKVPQSGLWIDSTPILTWQIYTAWYRLHDMSSHLLESSHADRHQLLLDARFEGTVMGNSDPIVQAAAVFDAEGDDYAIESQASLRYFVDDEFDVHMELRSFDNNDHGDFYIKETPTDPTAPSFFVNGTFVTPKKVVLFQTHTLAIVCPGCPLAIHVNNMMLQVQTDPIEWDFLAEVTVCDSSISRARSDELIVAKGKLDFAADDKGVEVTSIEEQVGGSTGATKRRSSSGGVNVRLVYTTSMTVHQVCNALESQGGNSAMSRLCVYTKNHGWYHDVPSIVFEQGLTVSRADSWLFGAYSAAMTRDREDDAAGTCAASV